MSDALIFMTVGILLTCTAPLRLRAAALPVGTAGTEHAMPPPATADGQAPRRTPAPPGRPARPAGR